jgi:hypothetical protein
MTMLRDLQHPQSPIPRTNRNLVQRLWRRGAARGKRTTEDEPNLPSLGTVTSALQGVRNYHDIFVK